MKILKIMFFVLILLLVLNVVKSEEDRKITAAIIDSRNVVDPLNGLHYDIIAVHFYDLNSQSQIRETICLDQPSACEEYEGVVAIVNEIVNNKSLSLLNKTNSTLYSIIGLYNQINKDRALLSVSQDLKIDASKKIISGQILVKDSGDLTWVINGDSLFIPRSSTIDFNDGQIKISLKSGASLRSLPKSLGTYTNIIEIRGENINLPEGNVLNKGVLRYSRGRLFLQAKDITTINGVNVANIGSQVDLYFNKENLNSKHYVYFGSNEIYSKGEGNLIDFSASNKYLDTKGKKLSFQNIKDGEIKITNLGKDKETAPKVSLQGNNISEYKIIDGKSEFKLTGKGDLNVNSKGTFQNDNGMIPLEINILDFQGKSILKDKDNYPRKLIITKDQIGYATADLIVGTGGEIACNIQENSGPTGYGIREWIVETARCKFNVCKWYTETAIDQNALFDGRLDPGNSEEIAQIMKIDKTKLDQLYARLNTRAFKSMEYTDQLNYIFRTASEITNNPQEYLRLVSVFASNYKHLKWVQLRDAATGKAIDATKYKALVPQGKEYDKVYHLVLNAGTRMKKTGVLDGVLLRGYNVLAEVGSSELGRLKEMGRLQGQNLERYRWDREDIRADFAGASFAERLNSNFDGAIDAFDITNSLPTIKTTFADKVKAVKFPSKGYYSKGDGYRAEGSSYQNVKTIQELVGIAQEQRDGIFGSQTSAKVKEWQESLAASTGICTGKMVRGACKGDGLFGKKSLLLAKCVASNTPEGSTNYDISAVKSCYNTA